MITKHRFWLLAALFVLMGTVSAQAQDPSGENLEPIEVFTLNVQHVESDFVPVDECNYYRHFLTLENLTSEGGLNIYTLETGFDHFILYRYPTGIDGAIPTAVAELEFTMTDNGVNYEITYLNQEPLAGYDLDLVTEGTLAMDGFMLNLDGIVLVDQCKVELVDNGEWEDYTYGGGQNFDFSKLYYWTSCGYVMLLATDEGFGSNPVEVSAPVGTNLFVVGNYTRSEINEDMDAKLRPGMKNAYFTCFNLSENEEITGYTILRGDNTYPQDTISHLTRPGTERLYIEECNALPEYFGQEETWGIERMDTSKYVIGNIGDFMTYVHVIRVDGKDRVKNDGENTYGGLMSKTGVAGLDAWVDGSVSDQSSDDPFMWKDENGEDCAYFNPYFLIKAELPDYGTIEYKPEMVRVWVKCDNLRECYIEEDGSIVNLDHPESPMLLAQESVDDYYWDEELEEYVSGFDGWILIGDPESYQCEFGATYASGESDISFIIRFYYEAQTNMPLKNTNRQPSWLPAYCVVEKEIPWHITPVITGVKEIASEIEVGKTFYNIQGIASDTPHSGLNIVVTRYNDGSIKTTKVIL